MLNRGAKGRKKKRLSKTRSQICALEIFSAQTSNFYFWLLDSRSKDSSAHDFKRRRNCTRSYYNSWNLFQVLRLLLDIKSPDILYLDMFFFISMYEYWTIQDSCSNALILSFQKDCFLYKNIETTSFTFVVLLSWRVSEMSNKTASPNSFVPIMLMNQVQLGFDVFALVFGGLGNGMVLAVIVNKKQKNYHDIFVANLAVADILFILFSFPGDVFRVIEKAPRSLTYCATIRPLTTMFFCLGEFTITLMALYRCYVIVNPYKAKMKPIFLYLCVFALWVMSFITALPAIIVATVKPNGFCTGKWKSQSYKSAYIIFLLLIKCVIPLFLIAIAYIRLGVYLVQHKPVVTNVASIRRDRNENMKILRVIAFIVVVFALCTLPYQVGWSMLQFGDKLLKKKAAVMIRVTRMIQNLHTCVNPVIYAISRKYFRQEYKRYLRKLCCIKSMRVNPSSSDIDDFTQQPHHTMHAHNETGCAVDKSADEESPGIQRSPMSRRYLDSPTVMHRITTRVWFLYENRSS